MIHRSRKKNIEVKIFFISALLTISIFLCTINARALASQEGEIIWTQTSNPSDRSDYARAVAVDGSGLYVVGVDRSPGDGQWRIEKRIKVSPVGEIGTLVNVTHGGEWFLQRILLYLILAVVSLIVFISFKK